MDTFSHIVDPLISRSRSTSRRAGMDRNKGTRIPAPSQLWAERILSGVTVGIPALGTAVAIPYFLEHGVGILEVSLLLGLYGITQMFGMSLGLHRYFSHGSFRASPCLRVFLAIAAAMSALGPIQKWVADHRRHHRFSDREGDPHSPVSPQTGGLGLLWAHLAWFFAAERTAVCAYADELKKDRFISFIDRFYPVSLGVSILLPGLVGLAVRGNIEGFIAGALAGGCVRIFLVQQALFAVASYGHRFGQQAYVTRDGSKNNAWLAMVTFGEGYHNNHHAFPKSAVTDLDSGQLDLSGKMLELLCTLGLASHPVIPSTEAKSLRRRRIADLELESTNIAQALSPDFVDLFRRFEQQHVTLRQRLGDAYVSDASLERELHRFCSPYYRMMDELAGAASKIPEEDTRRHVQFVRESRLHRWILEAPYFNRIYERPRGYSGDAEMMRYIYRERFEGMTPFGRLYHRLATLCDECQAVRNRRAFLEEKLLAQGPDSRVLSLAVGPGAEITGALRKTDTDIRILGLDHDVETLRELAPALKDPRFDVGIANAFQFIKGDPAVAFPRENQLAFCDPAKDLKGARSVLAPLKYRLERLRPGSFDLVYSAGLFDYIETFPNNPRKGTIALTRKLFDLVRPGGELVIGNFSTRGTPGVRFLMQYVYDWNLIYRDDDQVLEFASGISQSDVDEMYVDREPLGINLFLRIRKANSSQLFPSEWHA